MNYRAYSCRVLLLVSGRALLLVQLVLMGGCATAVQKKAPLPYSVEVKAALLGKAILGHELVENELPTADLFAITPEMEAFAKRAVKNKHDTFEKVKALHVALLSPVSKGGLGIIYNAYSTQLPPQVFQELRANCLSFTLLYVTLARRIGLDAQVNDVKIPPTWDMRNTSSLMFLRHVNVKVPLRGGTGGRDYNTVDAVIDLEMNRYKPHYPQTYISDELIAAQFYSNHGMELAGTGNAKEGFLYLRKALLENDQQSYLWNNLASIFNQENLWLEAEALYLQGLQINPGDLTIITNLSGLYYKMNNIEQWNVYRQLAQRHRDLNPYYQYTLALSAFEGEDYENAFMYIKRAIARENNDSRFYQLAVSIYEKLGNLEASARMNKKFKLLSLRGQ